MAPGVLDVLILRRAPETVETLTVTAKVQRSEKADLGPAFSFFPHVT